MLAELEELDESRGWPRLFQRLNWEASQKAGALTAARLPENRQLNRYRDVLPYDHSRITLKGGSPDYINANLIEVTRLNKKYILTQGPLPHTTKHFWQMIWEQNTEAVIMLNRVVEKNQIKCYQYWPCGEAYGHVNHLEFGDFRIYYLQEMRNEYFTIRSLELENILTGERRHIDHFHYLTWPDFGVPTSPATFLAFLFEVRKTGVMSADAGPCVIHCSAGIGRSGTLVMVDLILTEIERMGGMDQIDIKAMLLEIRQYRVGLIQTPDQLRFTYLAILEGVRVLMPEIYQRAENHHFHLQTTAESGDQESETVSLDKNKKEQEVAEEEEETPPPLPPRRRLEATDEPVTKKSRTSDHEPKPEKEVLSDDSEGSDEIINLSSLSESEPEEDINIKVAEETHLGNDSLKENNEPSFVHAEIQQTMEDLQTTDIRYHSVREGLHPTDDGFQHTEKGIQPTDEGHQHTTEEGNLETTDEGSQFTEKDLLPSDKVCQLTEEGLPLPDQGCELTEKGLQPTDEGQQHTTEEGNLEATDEGCQFTEKDLLPTDKECQLTEEGLPVPDQGCELTKKGLQPRNERHQQTKEDLQPTDQECHLTEEDLQPTDKECQHGKESSLQPTDDGGVYKRDSITQARKRRREERKQKITDLVENIKKNVKREEDAKVWKSRLKNTLMVVAVCSLAYITFRYFTSG